jgi:hypothetical protein
MDREKNDANIRRGYTPDQIISEVSTPLIGNTSRN